MGGQYIQFPTYSYIRVEGFVGHPFMLPRYPRDKIILFQLVRQLKPSQALYSHAHKKAYFKFPITIGNYKCGAIKVVDLCEEELMTYHFEEFPLQRVYYDIEGNIATNIASFHAHVSHLEDYWLNYEDKHVVRRKKYERMTLGFA